MTFTKIVEHADLNINIPEMDKKLTKEEALNLIDRQIQKEMVRTGKTYMEVSREALHRFQEKREAGSTELNQYLNQKLEQPNIKKNN